MDMTQELYEVGESERLGTIAQSSFRVRMDLDHQPVRPDAVSGQRQVRYELPTTVVPLVDPAPFFIAISLLANIRLSSPRSRKASLFFELAASRPTDSPPRG